MRSVRLGIGFAPQIDMLLGTSARAPVRLTLFAVGVAITLPACGFAWIVHDRFQRDFTCPTEGIHVKARSDIRASSLLPAPPPPSSDVAANPARLAEWNRQQEAVRKNEDNFDVYDVEGCGLTKRYACAQVGAGPTQANECHGPYDIR